MPRLASCGRRWWREAGQRPHGLLDPGDVRVVALALGWGLGVSGGLETGVSTTGSSRSPQCHSRTEATSPNLPSSSSRGTLKAW